MQRRGSEFHPTLNALKIRRKIGTGVEVDGNTWFLLGSCQPYNMRDTAWSCSPPTSSPHSHLINISIPLHVSINQYSLYTASTCRGRGKQRRPLMCSDTVKGCGFEGIVYMYWFYERFGYVLFIVVASKVWVVMSIGFECNVHFVFVNMMGVSFFFFFF